MYEVVLNVSWLSENKEQRVVPLPSNHLRDDCYTFSSDKENTPNVKKFRFISHGREEYWFSQMVAHFHGLWTRWITSEEEADDGAITKKQMTHRQKWRNVWWPDECILVTAENAWLSSLVCSNNPKPAEDKKQHYNIFIFLKKKKMSWAREASTADWVSNHS